MFVTFCCLVNEMFKIFKNYFKDLYSIEFSIEYSKVNFAL